MIRLYTKNIGGMWFGVACDEEEIFATTFAESEKRVQQDLLKSIPVDVPFQHSEKTSVFAARVFTLLNDIYDGKDVSYSFGLAKEHLSDYTKELLKLFF